MESGVLMESGGVLRGPDGLGGWEGRRGIIRPPRMNLIIVCNSYLHKDKFVSSYYDIFGNQVFVLNPSMNISIMTYRINNLNLNSIVLYLT